MSLFKSLCIHALVLGLILSLPTGVFAGESPCPVNLGDFGLSVRNAVESSLQINMRDVLATRGAMYGIGLPHVGVARMIHEHVDGGVERHYRWLFRGDFAYLFTSTRTAKGWSEPKAIKAVAFPGAPYREPGQQLVSEPVRLPLYGHEPWMIAVAVNDHVVLLDAVFGKIVQTFHTKGQKVLSVSLTPRSLEVGTRDQLLVYHPHLQVTASNKWQGPVAVLPIGRPVEMILQGHMSMPQMNLHRLGERDPDLARALFLQGLDPDDPTHVVRQPLSILISGDKILMIGHNPNFSELKPFPVLTLSGHISASQGMKFFDKEREPPLPWTVLFLRVQGRPGITKLQTINSLVSFDEPNKSARQFSVKTVPDQHVLQKQFLVEVDLKDPVTDEVSKVLTLTLAGPGYQSGLVFAIREGGGIGELLDPEHLGQVRSVTPFQQLEDH